MSDALMTDLEIAELPKVWGIGGDGGMGDIGYQNVSKVVLQNRPNVKLLMLDTQVYSNTGGQNSDSTPMLGGGDMNSFGTFSQGKLPHGTLIESQRHVLCGPIELTFQVRANRSLGVPWGTRPLAAALQVSARLPRHPGSSSLRSGLNWSFCNLGTRLSSLFNRDGGRYYR